jgi:hypothetical protein
MLATGSMARRTSRFAQKCANSVGVASAAPRRGSNVRGRLRCIAGDEKRVANQPIVAHGIEVPSIAAADEPVRVVDVPSGKNNTGRTWRPVFGACRRKPATAPAQSCSSSNSA